MSANIKASTDGTQAIIGVGGVDQMTVSNAGVVTANSFVGAMSGNASSATALATGSITARTLANRFADVVNVRDFGAVGDGVTDDTAAFSAAALAAKTSEASSTTWGIEYAQRATIQVPSGTYKLNSLVDTGGKEITWICDHGAQFAPLPQSPSGSLVNLNGKLIREGLRFNNYHYGIKDSSVTFSLKSNPLEGLDEATHAFSDPFQIAYVPDRDSCTLYADNRNVNPLADIASATYTSTSINLSPFLTADIVKKLRPGMIIDTKHTPNKYAAFITSWANDGSSITVSGWFAVGNPAVGQVPPNGVGALISPYNKMFGQNTIMWMDNGANKAKSCAGYELGIYNEQGNPTLTEYYWGYDCVSRGQYKASIAHLARGRFEKAFYAGGAPQVGNDGGDQDVGFEYYGNGYGFVFNSRTTNQGQPWIFKNNGVIISESYVDGAIRCPNTARAWVNFDGTLANPITARNSYNVSWVEKIATGIYKIYFLIQLPNDTPSVSASVNDISTPSGTVVTIRPSAWSNAWIQVSLRDSSGTLANASVVNVTVFGSPY